MSELQVLQNYLLVGGLLFAIGLTGFLSRRNMIVMFLSAEMMLQAVALNLVAFSWYHNNWDGQMLVIFIITVAACEAAISLALVMMLYHRSGSLDMTFWQHARESSVAPFIDSEIPVMRIDPPTQFPKLTPAGVEPQRPEETYQDTHV